MNKHTTAIHVVHKTLLPIENNKTNCFVVRMLAQIWPTPLGYKPKITKFKPKWDCAKL